jgi:hypothetical protein
VRMTAEWTPGAIGYSRRLARSGTVLRPQPKATTKFFQMCASILFQPSLTQAVVSPPCSRASRQPYHRTLRNQLASVSRDEIRSFKTTRYLASTSSRLKYRSVSNPLTKRAGFPGQRSQSCGAPHAPHLQGWHSARTRREKPRAAPAIFASDNARRRMQRKPTLCFRR